MNLARMMPCLSHEECDKVLSASHEWMRTTVISRKGIGIQSDLRSCDGCQLKGDLEEMAHAAINGALSDWSELIKAEYPDVYECFSLPGVTNYDTYRESLNLLRYEKDQEYKWHTDQPWKAMPDGSTNSITRMLSVVLYLNDDFQGGETEMPARLWRPEKGKALIFPSHWTYPHRARPVLSGTKYALVTWYHSK